MPYLSTDAYRGTTTISEFMRPNFEQFRTFILCMLVAAGLTECTRTPDPPVIMDPMAQRFLRAGEEARSRGQFERALALADSAEAYAPEETGIDFLRALVYTDASQFGKADSAYGRVAAREPHYRGLWNNVANLKMREGHFTEAIPLYRKEIAREEAPAPWEGMGDAYRELGNPDSAEIAYGRALAVDSTYARAALSLSELYDDAGEFDRALDMAQRALRHEPTSLNAQYQAGLLLSKTGQFEEAEGYLRAVSAAWPWHQGASYNLGQALMRTGHVEEGREYVAHSEALRKLDSQIEFLLLSVRNSPTNPYVFGGLGSAYRQAGRYDEAMRAYQVGLFLDPTNSDLLVNLAGLQFARKDTSAAVATYRKVIEHDPKNVAARLNMGVLLALRGRTTEAVQLWDEVLELDPENRFAKSYLVKVYKEQHHSEVASQ